MAASTTFGNVVPFATGVTPQTLPEAPVDGQTYGRRNARWVLAVAVAGDAMQGPLLMAGDPILPLETATKQYVDLTTADGGTY